MAKQIPGMAIILFGLDGSGKTTQARLLEEYARERSLPCRYLWLRVPWKLSLPLMAINRIAGITRKYVSDDGSEYRRTELWRSQFLSTIWKSWILFNFKKLSSSRVSKPAANGELVIIDRYVFDALVDYAIDNNNDAIVETAWDEFAGVLPEDYAAFYFDITAEESKVRKVGEDIGILRKRRELYQMVARKCSAVVIDATQDRNEIHQLILAKCGLE